MARSKQQLQKASPRQEAQQRKKAELRRQEKQQRQESQWQRWKQWLKKEGLSDTPETFRELWAQFVKHPPAPPQQEAQLRQQEAQRQQNRELRQQKAQQRKEEQRLQVEQKRQEAQQRRVALAEAPATGRGGHREQEERLRKLSGEERRFNAKHGII